MPSPHRARRVAHTGTLNLSLDNTSGTLYDQVNQDAPITLSHMNATPGGWALISIKANGDAITVPSGWILYGGDAIAVVADQVNHIQVFYKDSSTVYYTNKVV